MRWWPQGLAGRLLLAFVVAAAGIAVLALVVSERDAARAASRRPAASRAESPPARSVGTLLAPCRGRVLLAARIEALPPDVAPVLEVFADGSVALRRPVPLPLAPDAAITDAALLLPERSLTALGSAARTALLDGIAQLVAERPVPSDRVPLVDVQASRQDLDTLLGWVP